MNLKEGQMHPKNIFILGSGLMGSGIAQVCAQAGLTVTLNDVKQEALDKASKNIAWSVGKFAEKGTISESVDAVMARISTSTSLESAAKADLVIEAIFENIDVKREAFIKLDQAAGPETLLASNTSAIPISLLAGFTNRPHLVLGLHFFSPVPMMAVAEVIRGMATTQDAFDRGVAFVRKIGKEPVLVQRDVPAFVINRINYRANIEAMKLVEDGIVTVEDVDKGLRLGAGRRMGPFEIGDMVGLDVTYGALMSIYEETKDASFYPPAILRRKVQRGELGRKTGKGWYEYDSEGKMKK